MRRTLFVRASLMVLMIELALGAALLSVNTPEGAPDARSPQEPKGRPVYVTEDVVSESTAVTESAAAGVGTGSLGVEVASGSVLSHELPASTAQRTRTDFRSRDSRRRLVSARII
jgi:hypothetical protein